MGKTVLVLLDLQNGIVGRLDSASKERYLALAVSTLEAARAKDVPVIYCTISFRPGAPELSTKNKTFASLLTMADAFSTGKDAVQIPQSIAPIEGKDIVVVKKRISAFVGSDLDVVLRALGADHIVMGGISTSMVVMSTMADATDLDYQVTVLEDLCLDFEQEVHDLLVQKIFPRRANVVQAGAWVDSL